MKIYVAACLLASASVLSACQTTDTAIADKSIKTTSISKKAAAKKTTIAKVPYDALIKTHAKKNGVPVSLAWAVIQIESNYRANARGAAG
tara:strand:- start:1400 stop:1669 length:270 start_codon:yes stop_codon:yes gene_type:complete